MIDIWKVLDCFLHAFDERFANCTFVMSWPDEFVERENFLMESSVVC